MKRARLWLIRMLLCACRYEAPRIIVPKGSTLHLRADGPVQLLPDTLGYAPLFVVHGALEFSGLDIDNVSMPEQDE